MCVWTARRQATPGHRTARRRQSSHPVLQEDNVPLLGLLPAGALVQELHHDTAYDRVRVASIVRQVKDLHGVTRHVHLWGVGLLWIAIDGAAERRAGEI